MRMLWKEVLEFSVHVKAGYMRIVSLLLILDSTGLPKICPEFFTVRLKNFIKLGRAYFNSARSITHYIKYFDLNIRIQ